MGFGGGEVGKRGGGGKGGRRAELVININEDDGDRKD